MEVVGYTDRLSAAPGDDVRVMVSCSREEYSADLVRLIHGDPHPDGPGVKALPVASEISGRYPGRPQRLIKGSHLAVPSLPITPAVAVAAWLLPTAPGRGRQAVLGHSSWREHGIALTVEEDLSVALWVGGAIAARSEAGTVRARTWHFVAAAHSASGASFVGVGGRRGPMSFVVAALAAAPRATGAPAPFRVAAADDDTHFDGKIESPVVFDRALREHECEALRAGEVDPDRLGGVLARWDLGADPSTREVADASGRGHDGRLVNFPTRAVTGHRWSGREVDFRLAAEEYGAVHFHADDLDDAAWEPCFTWSVPDGLASGVYGIRLRGGATEDVLPVFVRPGAGAPRADVALLLPTFSYLAYANQHLRGEPEWREAYRRLGSAVDYPRCPEDDFVLEEELHSLYDRHRDGSGVCHASWLRPLVTMRPGYLQADVSLTRPAAHQLAADLHLVDWLHEQGHSVDVITDDHCHAAGAEALAGYRVVITGSHPEYVTWEILDALEAYVEAGGRLMYLGGNGFYWVTGLDPEEGHTIEVRRCGAATRSWDAAPGEWHLSTTGELGGLWRHRGRAPQRLCGVGFTAQGIGPNRAYRRTPAGRDERYAFVFEGLDPDEPIGAHPALVNDWGAAGFEIDRADPGVGSPEWTTVLATATGFSDLYQHVIEEALESDSRQGGSVHPDVRADMVLVEHPNGGAVFSPGSIAWCSGLSHDRYDNSVARVTGNVLRRFLAAEPLPRERDAALLDNAGRVG